MMFGWPIADLDEDEDEVPKTWPPAGSAALVIREEKDELFFSAEWTVRARVDGKIMWESKPQGAARWKDEVDLWARRIIRTHYRRLRELGVDADAVYALHGGNTADLG